MQAFSWQAVIRETKFLAAIALISVVQTWFNCQRCHNDARSYALISLFCFCIWVLLWRGNAWLTNYTEKRIPWLKEPVKRFVVGIVSTILYTIGVVLLLMSAFKLIFGFSFGNALYYTLVYSVVITLLVCLFLHGREFFYNWRKLELNAVTLRNENLTARFESLKSQLDPHFLFNSLNVLTNLVYQNADQSAAFIKQLSEVYRYVLDIRHKELVTLQEEMAFVGSFLYLNQIRFGSKLIFDNRLQETEGLVPPLAIQMLVENSIKHNVISEDEPLTITISREDEFVVVANNLQRRHPLAQAEAGIGLENISKRYEMLSDKELVVEETARLFKVKIPIIKASV